MHHQAPRFAFRVWLLFVPLACSGSSRNADVPKPVASASASVAAAPSPRDPCEVAADLQKKVKPFLDEGRLHRTVRLIEKADRLCPKLAPETWAALVTTLAELGKYAEARKVAAQIEADANVSAEARAAANAAKETCDKLDKVFPETDEAKQEMRQLFVEAQRADQEDNLESKRVAREKYLAAWKTWRPNGQALVGAGYAAKKLGQNAEAQRLFDRAIVEAEKAQSKEAVLDAPNGFEGGVRALAWSGDGRRFAVSDGYDIVIFDSTWRRRFRLQGHENKVQSLAFTPDGQTLASGASDQTLRLWDMTTGQEIRKLDGDGNNVNSVACSPDGKTVAATDGYSKATVWSLKTGKVVHSFDYKFRGWGDAIAYSPDGKTFASSDGAFIRRWNWATGALLGTLDDRDGTIKSFAYSPDGASLVSGDNNGSIRLWNTNTGKLVRTFEGQSAAIFKVVYSSDGKTVAAASDDETIRIWDATTGKLATTFAWHEGSINGIAYSPDGRTIAAAVDHEYVRFVDVATGKILRVFGWHTPSATSVAYSRNGQTLASGAFDKTVRLWDIAAGNQIRTLAGHTASVNSVAFAPDGTTVASGSADHRVQIWDVLTGKPLRTLAGHEDQVTSVVYSPDGTTLASGSVDNTIRLWDVTTGNLKRKLEGHTRWIYSLAYSPDGKTLASGSDDTTVRLWNVTSGDLVRTFDKHKEAVLWVAYTPDGQNIVSIANGEQVVRLWNPTTGEIQRDIETIARSAVYAPDGKTLAMATWSNTVEIWDVATTTKVHTLSEHRDEITFVAYSPDGKLLASCDNTGSVLIHRVDDGVLLATLNAISGMDSGYLFTPSSHIDILGRDACSARQYPVCRIGNLVFPFDVCEERFYSPGLLAKVHSGDTSYVEPENAPALMNCHTGP